VEKVPPLWTPPGVIHALNLEEGPAAYPSLLLSPEDRQSWAAANSA
jgi:hypothetical protein